MTRVKAVRNLVDLADMDIGREHVVDSRAKRRGRHVRVQLQMCDLRERMHSGIGSSGAIELELSPSSHLADGLIDLPLHGSSVLLNLPPAVARAGVFDDELVAGHEIG